MGSYCTGLKEGKKHTIFSPRRKTNFTVNIADVYFLSVSFLKIFVIKILINHFEVHITQWSSPRTF